jgi:hypothetical protein
LIEQHRRLVRPASADISNVVSSAAQHQRRQSERFDEFDRFAVPFHRQIEATQTIARQTVGTTLKNNGTGTIHWTNKHSDAEAK